MAAEAVRVAAYSPAAGGEHAAAAGRLREAAACVTDGRTFAQCGPCKYVCVIGAELGRSRRPHLCRGRQHQRSQPLTQIQ